MKTRPAALGIAPGHLHKEPLQSAGGSQAVYTRLVKCFNKSSNGRHATLVPNQINAKLRRERVTFEATQRVPVMTDYRASGCLLSYGPDYAAMFRRMAEFVARILNGAKVGALPMEQPTKLEFVVNLKVARAIGLIIPQSVLLRADEVIS